MLIINCNNEASSYMRVPAWYKEVEYIESTGTQWIDTSYIPNVNTEISTKISRGTQSTQWGVFFGVTGNDRSSDGILGRIYSSTSTSFNPWFCNANYDETTVTVTLDTFNTIVLKKNGGTVNGTAYTVTTNSTPYQSSIVLFWGNNGGSKGRRCGKCKIKEFIITEWGTKKREFIPCYRVSDGVIGLWDRVGKTFYTNAGSGTFTKGSDV